jgi:hypothetical protein
MQFGENLTRSCRLRPTRSTDQAMTLSNSHRAASLWKSHDAPSSLQDGNRTTHLPRCRTSVSAQMRLTRWRGVGIPGRMVTDGRLARATGQRCDGLNGWKRALARIVERSHPDRRKPVRRFLRLNRVIDRHCSGAGRRSSVPRFHRPDNADPCPYLDRPLGPRLPPIAHRRPRTHAPSLLQNIRLSADVGNPLSRSRNSWADGDGCVCLCLDAGAAAAGSRV